MRFFDSKEEVIDIQLTQEGKRKLAMGRFKPKYYAFFDDDILYDSQYAGYDEEQNDSVPRIMDETPRMRVQYQNKGVETNFRKLKEKKRNNKNISNEMLDRNSNAISMGTSGGDENAPVWKISLGEGQFSGSVDFYNVSWGVQNIPQLSSSVEVVTKVEFEEGYAFEPELGDNSSPGRPLYDPLAKGEGEILNTTPDVYSDGSYLVTVQPSLILNIEEINNQFNNENFDIEVFEVIQSPVQLGSDLKEVLRPLYFSFGGEFENKDEYEISEEVTTLNPNYVQHYIDVLADGELDADAIEKLRGKGKGKADTTIGTLGGETPYGGGDALGRIDPDDSKEPC